LQSLSPQVLVESRLQVLLVEPRLQVLLVE